MNQMLKGFLCVAALATTGAQAVAPYYSIRSQGLDSARELVGWTNHTHLYDKDGFYGSFAIIPEFTRSFRSSRIAETLFGPSINSSCDSDCTSIGISGSRVAGRSCCDWLADYFGLPTDFQSTVSFRPRISNFLVDFNLYLGLNEWMCGLYMELKLPVVYTRWNLRACENVINAGVNGYDAGYFTPTVTTGEGLNAVPRSNLLCSFQDFMNGRTPNLPGVTFNPLTNSVISFCNHHKSGVAELRAILGWDFLQGENYHFGLGIRAAAPTGTRPDGDVLFEPIVGNGKQWELGGQLTTHWTFWRSDCDDANLSFWVEANLTTLFKARQRRAFDLCGRGANSRYMLAERLGTPVTNLFAGPVQASAVAPVAQFKNELTTVANLTTLDVKVKSSIQADVLALFNYTHCGFSFDLGYNFWGRSCERIERDCDCGLPFAANTWALKGDAHVYGFTRSDATTAPNTAVALSATENNATINAGTNTPCTGSFSGIQRQNPNIDNPNLAWVSTSGINQQIQAIPNVTGANLAQTNTSLQPVFLSLNDIDYGAARTRGLSSSIFAHFSYTWMDAECWVPFLGVGGKVEFAHHKRNSDCGDFCGDFCDDFCSTSCGTSCSTNSCFTNSCATTTNCFTSNSCGISSCNDSCSGCNITNISQWGIWLKGGISFN
ncbi:hypothetical protein Noda2021_05880 [Candidatus Dependentiae bacterium Noda2021]|nr:hypothetical protein Noda2021_05880 [Candidatus Dependentiae bacterium Noda2021]